MLQKWKIILANWINCYFDKDTKNQYSIKIESLVNIITHLRDNLNLDESNSSILKAHTIQDFMLEKYPQFRFENGNIEPMNEEEIYLTASLLLYFVCVNSKDVDIKKAMCKKLSAVDQEIILKFSKCLMDCSHISSTDVLNAIEEACGHDATAADTGLVMVSETPPALRSLHNEVRRLHAALEAERFDRNFLQEELARTNVKLENLVKDKEQYKQDIVNLKAKLSTTREDDSIQGPEVTSNSSVKLVRQLEQMEQSLVTVQEKLDDVQYERDTYKFKLDELKCERDKIIATSQEESARADQLAVELETERRHVHSLRELVVELRQHNRLNGLDTSQLECDDPNGSFHSLQHNNSVCDEACANIIEVQLSEERAKIDLLKQQIQSLQDQLREFTEKSDEENLKLTKIISEKDTDIFNLKHRINEEIEERNTLKLRCDDEVTRLNNEVNELGQRLRGNGENSRRIIDSKLKEIQILHEEKLALLQSITNETTKYESIIQNLKSDVDTEKSLKLKMKEDYDNKLMKLNEKVLNRNNELVELQNKIFGKGEIIEKLQFDLRKEKELRVEFVNKYNNDIMDMNTQIQAYEDNLKHKNDEISTLKDQLEQYNIYNKQLEKDIENLRSSLTKYKDDNKVLEDYKEKLLFDLRSQDLRIEDIQKEKQLLQSKYTEEKKVFQYNLDEVRATAETLRIQLQNEIQYKIGMQNELLQYEISNKKLTESINNLNELITTLESNCNETEQILITERIVITELKDKCVDLHNTVEKLNEDISEKTLLINATNKSLDQAKIKIDEERREKEKVINLMNTKLTSAVTNVSDLETSLDELRREKDDLMKDISDKNNNIAQLQNEIVEITHKAEENENTIDNLKSTINDKIQAYNDIQTSFDTEKNKLVTTMNEMDKSLKELQIKSNNTVKTKEVEIETLKLSLQEEYEKSSLIEKEKKILMQQLNQANAYKTICENEYLNKCAQLVSITTQFNEELSRKNAAINDLKHELEISAKYIKTVENDVSESVQNGKDVALKKDSEIEELCEKIKHLEPLKTVIDKNLEAFNALQKENCLLRGTIEKDSSSNEILIKEKDSMIKRLENQLENHTETLQLLQKEYENDKFSWAKLKNDMQEEVNAKVNEITQLSNKVHSSDTNITALTLQVDSLRKTCTESGHTNDSLKESLLQEKALRDVLTIEKENLIKENDKLLQKITTGESAYRMISSDKDSLLNEKAILIQELMEEKSLRKIADEGNDALSTEKQRVDIQLRVVENMKNVLSQEKECLTQQLVEERLAKDLAELEKKNIIDFKEKLEAKLSIETMLRSDVERKNESLKEEIGNLKMEYAEEKSSRKNLETDFMHLKLELDSLAKENGTLNSDLAAVKSDSLSLKTDIEMLTHEKDSLQSDKDMLTNSCKELKMCFDNLISTNNDLQEKFSDLNDKMNTEIEIKIEEIKMLTNNYDRLVSDFNVLRHDKENLTSTLNNGINKVFVNMNNDNVLKDILSAYNNILIGNESVVVKCDVLFNVVNNLISELTSKKNLEIALEKESEVVKTMSEMANQKDIQITQLQDEIRNLETTVKDSISQLTKLNEKYNSLLDTNAREIQKLQLENQTLRNEVTDVKAQLDVKVHSLKDKLIDNENVTDKLKKTYECQIGNLNMMITKISNYLKEKTTELDLLRKEKESLQHVIEENNESIKTLEDNLKIQKQNQEKLVNDFESERLVLKNMVTVTESVMEDQKVSLNKIIAEHTKSNRMLEEEIKSLKHIMETERADGEIKLQEKAGAFETAFRELSDTRKEKEVIEKDFISQKELFENKIFKLMDEVSVKKDRIDSLTSENKEIQEKLMAQKQDYDLLREKNNEWKIKSDSLEVEFGDEVKKLQNDLDNQCKCAKELEVSLKNKEIENSELLDKVNALETEIATLEEDKLNMAIERNDISARVEELKTTMKTRLDEHGILLTQTMNEFSELKRTKEEMKTKITELEELLQIEVDKGEEYAREKINLLNKCCILEEYRTKSEIELEKRQKEINRLQGEIEDLTIKTDQDLIEKDKIIAMSKEENVAIMAKFDKELKEERVSLEDVRKQVDIAETEIRELRIKLDNVKQDEETITILKKENERLIEAIGDRETFDVANQKKSRQVEHRDLPHQVDNTSSDYSSMENSKTITDLEKIVQDKNRTITTLQTDITYLKSLIAESENKSLDLSNDLEISKENCQQLASQLKKIVHQKNEEIAELKKQSAKLSANENRASQIIKVSAKYQAIILKRIAEIKSNTVLKELTNFGNPNCCDNDLRRGLTAGTVTMEELENFLETTERHIRRCSEKQTALQKERDRLIEVNRINESEIINMKKFLTELSVSIKTFNSVKELYINKLSRVVSLQRTVRREILNLDNRIAHATIAKMERGYSAVMQDLFECAMNLERWMERCIARTICSEKINQAFITDNERASLSSETFQNTGLEYQLEELQKSFKKLLEDVARAQKNEGGKDAQPLTAEVCQPNVMEIRAEYEDKLNRMKAKMRELYEEQISIFKSNQNDEITRLEAELKKSQFKMLQCEEHIKSLTTELWTVGEKYLMKKNEAAWLKKKHSGSLMSLQHVHSSGLVPPQEEPSRPFDAHSLCSLPANSNNKQKERRGLVMSDEEGEVFDNRFLRELASTPRREGDAPPGHRISELRWRNSLCPPHLKSSYPAETQFAPAIHEEDIKCMGSSSMSLGGKQRKEVGITAYKKPGPPTPSKQAGRLSATDSELRESLRIESDPSASRKTSTPSRLRSLFRSAKNDTTEGTPRSRRLSSLFRKK